MQAQDTITRTAQHIYNTQKQATWEPFYMLTDVEQDYWRAHAEVACKTTGKVK